MKKAIPVLYPSRNTATRLPLLSHAFNRTMTAGASSDKPPPEFPAAPPPDKDPESSEAPQAPSVPDSDRTPSEIPPSDDTQPPRHDPYVAGPELPNPRQQHSRSRVVQPHGAKVQTPVPPEPEHVTSA
nr:pollen-specific leucine-rich repeat extensin-like protein 1 [Ipomoea trifida]